MQATTQPTTEPKAAGNDHLPDGLNASEGVEYLARLEGFEGDHLPGAVILSRGFSETTGFFKDSKGRGYYMTTFNECSCPDYKYRKVGTSRLCKHQKKLIKIVQKREFDEAKAEYDEIAKTYRPEPLPDLAMDERKARIDERNRELREERAARAARVPSTGTRGFNCPDEVAA